MRDQGITMLTCVVLCVEKSASSVTVLKNLATRA